MNLYFKLLTLVVFLIFVFGVAAPYLISAKSTELVLGGFALMFVVAVPVSWKLGKGIFNDITNILNKENSNAK